LNNDGNVFGSLPRILKQLEVNHSFAPPWITDFDFFFSYFFCYDSMRGIIAVNNEKIDKENWKNIFRKIVANVI
jgi:hypothetical protein